MAAVTEFRKELAGNRSRRLSEDQENSQIGQELFHQAENLLYRGSSRRVNLGRLMATTPIAPFVAIAAVVGKTTLRNIVSDRYTEIQVRNGVPDSSIITIRANHGDLRRAREVEVEVKGVSRLSVFDTGYARFRDYSHWPYLGKDFLESEKVSPNILKAQQRLLQAIV